MDIKMPKPSVLIIDDCAPLLIALQTLFSDEGFTVYTAQTVEQAKGIPVGTDYALVDLCYPDNQNGGVEYVDWAMNNRPDCDCIMMSSHEQKLEQVCDNGLCDTILKGLEPKDILREFKVHVRSKRKNGFFADQYRKMNQQIDRLIETKSSIEPLTIETRHPEEPTKMCEQVFQRKPSFWAFVSYSVVAFGLMGSVAAYAIATENRITKVEEFQKTYQQTVLDKLNEIQRDMKK